MKNKPMQFTINSKNTIFQRKSVHIPLDYEPFGLQKETEFDEKLLAYTERLSSRNHTIASNKSASSFTSGNQLINTYSSLIQQMSMGKSVQQFCTHFGVPFKELERIDDQEEREDFVIESMGKHIKVQLQQFFNKLHLKQHDHLVEEWQDMQKLKRSEKEMNIFSWIDVKSKYTHLRKKLQYALINTLTEDQNQVTIKDYFTERKSLPVSRTGSVSTSITRRTMLNTKEPLKIIPKVQVQNNKGVLQKWNDHMEKEYKIRGRRSSAVGLYPLIQQSILENVGQNIWSNQREALLQKYTEGGPLTADEVKFIANTSTLMNKCADKEFLLRTIKYLDKDIIEDIENQIAENILQNYHSMLVEAKKLRKDWLKEQNKINRELFQSQQANLIKKIQVQINQKHLSRIKKKMISIFKDLMRKNQKEEEDQEERDDYIKRQPGKNRVILKFKDKMLKIVKQKRNKQQIIKHQQFLDRNIPKKAKLLFKINNEIKDTEYIKRLFHPPSKVMLVKDENTKKEEKRYHIPIRSMSTSKLNFVRYLSGGPSGGPQAERNYSSQPLRMDANMQTEPDQDHPHDWITSEIEVLAINKIKASIRAYIERKKYQKIKVLPQNRQLLAQRREEEKQERFREKKVKQDIIKQIQSLIQVKRISQQSPQKRINNLRRKEEMKLKTRKLFQAAQKRCLAIALQSGFVFNDEDVNYRDEFGRTPLSYAAENGDEQISLYLLSLGSNVNVKSKEGNTPMHYAFKSNKESIIVRFMHEKGDLNILNNDGLTPLAFGSEITLRRLNLINLVSSVNGKDNKQIFDNNSSINKRYPKSKENDDKLEFKITIGRFE